MGNSLQTSFPDLMTYNEAMEFLGVSYPSLQRYLQRNGVPVTRIGRLCYVSKAALCSSIAQATGAVSNNGGQGHGVD